MNDLQKQIQASSFNAVSLIRKLHPTLVAQSIVGVQPMTDTFKRLFRINKPMNPKYNFSRARWYDAEYKAVNYIAARTWCTEKFGPQPDYPDAWSRWYQTGGFNTNMRFRDEQDYMWFVLRWGA